MAIGARSQSARTYLEKNLDKFPDSNQDELIKHCMRALRDTLPNEVELTVKVYIHIFKFRIFFFFCK
jgi:20S proteasome subunit alpha 6